MAIELCEWIFFNQVGTGISTDEITLRWTVNPVTDKISGNGRPQTK